VSAALVAGRRCSISPRMAAQQIGSAADENRRTLFLALNTIPAPTNAAGDAITQLQKAIGQSYEADPHYRNAFLAVGTTPRPCVFPQSAEFARAGQFDQKATAAKIAFVNLFNPIAARYRARTWDATEF
jgi:hypothetical protein